MVWCGVVGVVGLVCFMGLDCLVGVVWCSSGVTWLVKCGWCGVD